MYHEIKGIIYRVNFQYGSCFVECDEEKYAPCVGALSAGIQAGVP